MEVSGGDGVGFLEESCVIVGETAKSPRCQYSVGNGEG